MRCLIAMAIVMLVLSPALPNARPWAERVTFLSRDNKTTLVGYLFMPGSAHGGSVPAVVMMHGRAGAYSSRAHGTYDAGTLSMRHQEWGERWAAQGYLALMVDGFGPRGYPQGFPRHSYDQRPAELSETTVRPLDAYGALAYLRSRPGVTSDQIGVMGWSNGGSATLATMSVDAPGIEQPSPQTGFRAALVYYPGCGLHGHFDAGYMPYGPVRVFHGAADEEVSAKRCQELVERSRAKNGDIEITIYPGATHDFDDPGRKRRGVAANAAANRDAVTRSLEFFAQHLQGR
jgi:carboxymethylenebutenolidase